MGEKMKENFIASKTKDPAVNKGSEAGASAQAFLDWEQSYGT